MKKKREEALKGEPSYRERKTRALRKKRREDGGRIRGE